MEILVDGYGKVSEAHVQRVLYVLAGDVFLNAFCTVGALLWRRLRYVSIYRTDIHTSSCSFVQGLMHRGWGKGP